MKIIVITSILSYAFGAWWDGPKCTAQWPSWELTCETTPPGLLCPSWKTAQLNKASGCWDENWSCGSVRIEGTGSRRVPFRWPAEEETITLASQRKHCAANNACNKLAGGTSGNCQYAQVTIEKWKPTSCNVTADFDAITEAIDTKFMFACCNDPDYCNKDEDFSSCSESTPFTNYMVELNKCWRNYRQTFMKELLCDAERGDILTYVDNCKNEDGSDASITAGQFNSKCGGNRFVCAQQLRDILVDYGSCACAAASSNGFTGEFIGTAQEVNWQKFCPGIEVECAADGVVKILYKFWRARLKFRIAVAKEVIIDTIIAAWKAHIAARLGANEEIIIITNTDDEDLPATTATGRRLLVSESAWKIEFDSEDESLNDFYKTQLTQQKDEIATELSEDAGGATISDTEVQSEEAEDITTGEYVGDATKNTDGGENGVNGYVMYGVIVAVILGLIN